MIRDFERYHGVALRRLIVGTTKQLTIRQQDSWGRINHYLINDSARVYIKHCAKRLPPWQFSFSREQVDELGSSRDGLKLTWLILVCGCDGVVSLSYDSFVNLVVLDTRGGTSIRVDRSPREQYRVSGKNYDINEVIAEGVVKVLDCVVGEVS